MVRLFRANTVAKISILAFVALAILMCTSVVRAEQSSVNATICNYDAPSSASLTILEPESGLVFNVPQFTAKATVKDLAQVQVLVDGQYSNTIPIDANQSDLSTVIGLSAGTHVIKFVGIDVCQIDNPTDEFTVTYEPASVNTSTPPKTAGVGQGTVSDAVANGNNATINIESPLAAIPRQIGNITQEILKAIDILLPGSAEYVPATTTRFALVLAGSMAIIWPELTAIAIHHNWFVWRGRRFTWHLKEVKRVGPRLILRIGGIVLIVMTLLS